MCAEKILYQLIHSYAIAELFDNTSKYLDIIKKYETLQYDGAQFSVAECAPRGTTYPKH